MNIPDRWVVIRIKKDGDVVNKVLAGYSGGYLDGDSWMLNSGIKKVTETDTYYDFLGYSGSVYRCFKNRYGMSLITTSIFNGLVRRHGKAVKLVKKYEKESDND